MQTFRAQSRPLLPLLCAMSWLVTFPALAQAATYYVSNAGNNGNSGSQAAPWQTISFGVTRLVAGDTLYIRGGVYTGISNSIDDTKFARGGNSFSNAITIAGYPGEAVEIQPPYPYGAISLSKPQSSYFIFQDFTVNMGPQGSSWPRTLVAGGAGPCGVYVSSGAHHNRFLRLTVKDNQGNGICLSDNGGNAPFNEILQCVLSGNGRYAYGGPTPGENQGYGIYMFTSDNLIDGNDIHDNDGYGIHAYGTQNQSRNVFRNNRVYGNGVMSGGQTSASWSRPEGTTSSTTISSTGIRAALMSAALAS